MLACASMQRWRSPLCLPPAPKRLRKDELSCPGSWCMENVFVAGVAFVWKAFVCCCWMYVCFHICLLWLWVCFVFPCILWVASFTSCHCSSSFSTSFPSACLSWEPMGYLLQYNTTQHHTHVFSLLAIRIYNTTPPYTCFILLQ